MDLKNHLRDLLSCEFDVNQHITNGNDLLERGSPSNEARYHFEASLILLNDVLNSCSTPVNDNSQDAERVHNLRKKLVELRKEIIEKIIIIRQETFLEHYGSLRFDVIYRCEGVKLYLAPYSSSNLSIFLEDETLLIFKIADGSVVIGNKTKVFLQVGRWVYPLNSVNRLEQIRDNIFIFCSNGETAVGLFVPPEDYNSFVQLLEEITERVLKASGKIISGSATFVAGCLTYTATKFSDLVTYVTPSVLSIITPQEQPTKVSENVEVGAEIAKSFSAKAASGTGYLASKVGDFVGTMLDIVAPTITNKATEAVSLVSGMDKEDANKTVGEIMSWTSDAFEGMNILYDGIKSSGAIIGTSLASSSVQVVQHTCGEPAGRVTKNTFDTVGNVLNTSSNVRSMMPKSIVKKSLKETSKAILLNIDQPSNVDNSSISYSGIVAEGTKSQISEVSSGTESVTELLPGLLESPSEASGQVEEKDERKETKC